MTAPCRRCDWTPDLLQDRDAQILEHVGQTGHNRCPLCRTSLLDTEPRGGCERCLSKVAGNLATVALLFAELPDHLGHLHGSLGGAGGNDGHPLPGGTVLALLADGSEGLSEDGLTTKDGDPPSISYEVGWWAIAVMDDRSETVELGHRPPVVVRRAVEYLTGRLRWAAVTFSGFPDLATDTYRWIRALEAATGRTEPTEAAGAPCLTCGGDLVREIGHQGRSEDWTCRRCPRTLTQAQYLLAVRASYEEQVEWMLVSEAARRLLLTRQIVNGWASRGLVPSTIDEHGRRMVRWSQTRERARMLEQEEAS